MKKHILYYNRLVKRYNKYQRKLERAKESSFHHRRIDILIKRIRTLYQRINELGTALKAATAGGAVALSMMLAPMSADAQEFRLQTSNAAGLAHAENFATPTFVDIDDDDDLDLVIGERYGTFEGGLYIWINEDGEFTWNTSTALSAINTQIDSVHNRPDADNGGAYNRPAFIDVDGDDDLDLFIGQSDGNPDEETTVIYDRIRFFENDAGQYVEKFGAENPLSGFSDGDFTKPVFADLNGDGDLDAVIGKGNGEIDYWENNGDGTFTDAATNPFNGLDVGERAAPSFADLDGDGDLDAWVGNKNGDLVLLENSGTAQMATFAVDTVSNPFGNQFNEENEGSNLEENFSSEAQGDLVPVFADIDGDDDLDLFAGGLNGPLMYLENDGSNQFTWIEANDLGIQDIGNNAIPTIADADEDGDLDILISKGADVTFFTNDGEGNFDDTLGNPFDIVNTNIVDSIASGLSPTFVDWNGDTYVDLFVGTQEGPIFYFENNGDATWTDKTLTDDDPFKDYDPAGEESLAFLDLDNDGDLDCFIGNKDGDLLYFENDGSGNLTQTAGPFDDIDFGGNRLFPATYDMDRDGDQDMLIGKEDGSFRYFANNGDGTFTEGTGDDNPFNGVQIVRNAAPAFGDIDGDGVQDVLVGDRAGNSWFFKNVDGTAVGPTAATVADQFAIQDQAFSLTVDEFTDANNDIVVYRAVQADGSPIPAWLSFDRSTRTFSGTPSSANAGAVDLKVVAVDADNNQAEAAFTLYVQTITGVGSEDIQALNVYPNPFEGHINVSAPWKSEKSIELFTLTGTRIKLIRTSDLEIRMDMTDVPRGVYLLRVLSSEGKITRQILKN